MSNPTVQSKTLRGIGVTARLAAGPLCFYRERNLRKRQILSHSKEEEWARMQQALELGRKKTVSLYERALQMLGDEEAQIFEIHAMLLEDGDFLDSLRAEIDAGKCAEDALESASHSFQAMLISLNDPYLSARAADIRDIAKTVMEILCSDGENDLHSDTPFILVADDLTPSQTVLLDKSKILGFVTFRGTPNSHTAILARAMGIPALVDVGTIGPEWDGSFALLNAADGKLTLSPSQAEIAAFSERQHKEDRIAQEHDRYLRSLMNKPATTKSGHRILIYANLGDGDEVPAALANGADGIGLLRSEFLYLSCTDYPSEEKLFRAYAEIAQKMQGKRTVIRTLDVGADKKITYFGLPEEENPAMGFRAIRVCLARKDLFKTQLRAVLRASALGRLSLMLPMVVSVEEVRESRRLLEECMEELKREGLRFDSNIEFGIMIETPAAVMMCEELAREVDFFSVGTNDLSQYTLAADRQNPALDRLIRENTEPILRMIAKAADAIHHRGGWIGVCGELAADLSLTQKFADLAIDELSVSVPYLLGVRGKVSECN